MNKWIIIIILSSLKLEVNGQSILSKKIPEHGKTVKSFIPKGWIVLSKAVGDYNKDGIKDYAIVTVDSLLERITADVSRSIVILEGTKDGFILTGSCDSAVLCLGCGGIHGDPLSSLKFNNGSLVVRHVGGSAYRWELTNKFAYNGNQWLLTRATTNSYYSLKYCKKLQEYGGKKYTDINYSTGEVHKKEVSERDCKITLDQRKKIKKKTLTRLQDFNINR